MKEKLAELLIKRLNEDGFKSHTRHCIQCSHYGKIDENGMFIPDDEIMIEEWSNEDLINWLLNVDDKEISNQADEINNLLKH